jgi:ParB family chromosome partitioning protein
MLLVLYARAEGEGESLSARTGGKPVALPACRAGAGGAAMSAQPIPEAPEVRCLPLADVQPDPDQHRKHFPEEYLDGLAESIQVNGQLDPVKVIRHGDGFQLGACPSNPAR